MTPKNLFRSLRAVRTVMLALALALPLGFGLVACKKKPSADKKQSHEAPVTMDAMRAMDGMIIMDGMDAMETPGMGPDAGVVDPKGNKGMMPMKRLQDHTQ